MQLIILASLVIQALAQTPSSLTGLPSDVAVVYYDVGGRNARQVRSALALARPVVDGQAKDAVTRWRYDTSWSTRSDGVCLPATARIDYQITLTVPRLTDGRDLKATERQSWDAFVSSITAAEADRIRTVIEGLKRLESQLREITSCADLLSTRDGALAELSEVLRVRDEAAAEWQRRNRLSVPVF